jgi:hypothetical protein
MTAPGGNAARSRLLDLVRVAVLVLGFGFLAWRLVARYPGSGRGDAFQGEIREFFHAAEARDSARLRGLSIGDEPVRWALAAAGTPGVLPQVTDRVKIDGIQSWGDTSEVLAWGAGCNQPWFVTLVGRGRERRIREVRTECGKPGTRDTAR